VRYDDILETVEQRAGIPAYEAEHALRATLLTLGERISDGESHDIGRQLPPEVAPLIENDHAAQAFGVEEFLRRVADREGVVVPTAERHARAVFSALGQAISRGELDDMRSELPKDYERLLAAMRPLTWEDERPRAPLVPHVDVFHARVSQRTGLDREGAEQASDAVLDALGYRLSAGQAADLADQLPAELHPALEHGEALSGGEARPLSAEDLVRRVARDEAVALDVATDHVRAVLAVLREFVTSEELFDASAQLRLEYAALFDRP
jgi:uncharacterized protein (DUF2267 family)